MTPTDYADLIKTVQDNIVAILRSAVPKAVVHSRWVMDSNREAWAAALRSDADKDADDEPKIHAITVALFGIEPPAIMPAIGGVDLTVTFAIDFFVGYDAGNDETNSEATLLSDIIAALWALWQASDLNLRGDVENHRQLQMPPRFDVVPIGGVLVHRAPGTLTVVMQNKTAS